MGPAARCCCSVEAESARTAHLLGQGYTDRCYRVCHLGVDRDGRVAGLEAGGALQVQARFAEGSAQATGTRTLAHRCRYICTCIQPETFLPRPRAEALPRCLAGEGKQRLSDRDKSGSHTRAAFRRAWTMASRWACPRVALIALRR